MLNPMSNADMQKRSPWQPYGLDWSAQAEAGGRNYRIVVTRDYIDTRFALRADDEYDRHLVLEELESEVLVMAQRKLGQGNVLRRAGSQPDQIVIEAGDT